MARVRPITAGAVTSTGTIVLKTGRAATFGGFILNTDGTNSGTIVIRDLNVSGDVICDVSSIMSLPVFAPFHIPSGTIYYAISGTGADAQLFEWLDTTTNKYSF